MKLNTYGKLSLLQLRRRRLFSPGGLKIANKIRKGHSHRVTDVAKFRHVDSSFASLAFADERLSDPERVGEFELGDPGLGSRFTKEFKELLVVPAVN